MSGRDGRICIIWRRNRWKIFPPLTFSRSAATRMSRCWNRRAASAGGKCLTAQLRRSLDFDHRTANYITSDYTEVLRLAEEFDAALYAEAKTTTASLPPDGAPSFTSPLSLLTAKASFVSVLHAALRYLWIRWLLRKIIDRPGFAGVRHREELCRSFAAWLADNHLAVLMPMFAIPITAMGYGALEEMLAPYAIKVHESGDRSRHDPFRLGLAAKMAEEVRGRLSALVGESGGTDGRSLECECAVH